MDNTTDQANLSIEKVHLCFNPNGNSLAAEFWQTGTQKGFSPVCGNRFQRRMCRISKGVKNPCDGCPGQDYKPLTSAMFLEHIKGTKRSGIYPLGPDGSVAFSAADLDNHSGRSAPDVDLQKILEVCRLFDVPVLVFSSNSGNGFHVYLFFEKPIPAWKARKVLLTIIERAGVKTTSRGGSFDALFPKQDSLLPGDIGNLIALPFNGKAVKERGTTLLLNSQNGLKPYGENLSENIEYFFETLKPIDEQEVDRLLTAFGVERDGQNRGKDPNQNSTRSSNNERLTSLVNGCAFLTHCREKAATLPEPEWYLMTCILAGQYGGPSLVHELSRSHPGYSQRETDEKIAHALNDCPGPPTCETIQKTWPGCDCGCGVTTPLGLLWAQKGDDGDEVLKEIFLSDSKLIPIIPFPFDFFPNRLRQFVFKVAESHHVSSEIVAAAILPILAAAIGTDLKISPKKGWEVALFIWLAIIEPTGAGKSPVLNTLMDPLFRIQKDLWDEYQAEMKAWKEAEEERKNTKKKKDGGDSIHPTENEKPILRHLFTSDCTVEALGRIFSEDGHGIVIYRDELGGLMLGFNQYKGGKGDDRQKYLSIFDGQPFKIDRKSETLFIKKCGASILGGIQPGLLPQIFGEMSFIDGLAQRFLLFHQEQTPKRFNEKALEEEDQTFWWEQVRRCFDLLESVEDPQILIFTEEARRFWADFFNELHTVLPFLSEKAQGFIPKAITYSLKFIGLVHVLDGLLNSEEEQGVMPWKPIIQKEAVEKGILLSRFFLGQTIKALALYDRERNPVNGQKVRLIQVLFDLREMVKDGRLSLGEIRDVYNESLPQIATLPNDNRILSALLRSLGLETTRGTHGWATLIWDEKKLEKIFKNTITNITNVTPEEGGNQFGGKNGDDGDVSDDLSMNLKEGIL